MKAILEFNLPEDQHDHRCAIDGWRWKSVVSDITEKLRGALKYDESLTPETDAYLDKFRTEIFQMLEDRNLALYDE